jgi:hypothetical protein
MTDQLPSVEFTLGGLITIDAFQQDREVGPTPYRAFYVAGPHRVTICAVQRRGKHAEWINESAPLEVQQALADMIEERGVREYAEQCEER